ncbi:MEMO1 family [Lipomyces oligophaga]|uniref:MEMO1 family n=1 Tax=Lipomyces oligophaga TaxID=45792 RepID=UPI0034CD53C7
MKRTATHAGSWYLGDKEALDEQLTRFLGNVPDSSYEHGQLPVPGARIVIAPHAGYSYSGPTAAWAYKSWDVSKVKRVFLVGPSHHVYLSSCATSGCTVYETPLGDLPIDTDTIAELDKSGKFQKMTRTVDEEEHSLEMHLPYIYKMMSLSSEGIRPIVPIMVGALNKKSEQEFGKLLAKHIKDPSNGFVISSDFCHWGARFQFTNYVEDARCSRVRRLESPNNLRQIVKPDIPIYKSIEMMDYLGMDVASDGSHEEWTEYLEHTRNTICGRHPIGVILAGVEYLREKEGIELPIEERLPSPGTRDAEQVAKGEIKKEDAIKYSFGKICWVQYKQSSHCKSLADSSVSYASGFAKA